MSTLNSIRKALWSSVAALAFLALGCASSHTMSVYRHPNADLSAFKSIAVLPLDNLTTDRFANDRVREILNVELSSLGQFTIVDSGETNRVLRQLNVNAVNEAGPELIARIGKELKVQAVMLGSVMDYREKQNGTLTSPEVAISLRLIEVESGAVVWSASDARKGMSMWVRLFGVGEESQTEAVRELLRSLIDSLVA